MDEELKAMLEGAKAQGANDTDLGKIIDMYEADASKKKVSSNWGSDSQPKDTATSLVSGEWTKTKTNDKKVAEKVNPAFKSTIKSPIPDFNSMKSGKSVVEKPKIKLQKPAVKEDTSFFDYLKENLDTGLATVSKSIYDAPGLVYDAAASITNPIIKGLTGYDGEGASSDKLADDLGFRNIPSDILKQKIKVSNEKINAYSEKNGGDALKAVQDGNYVGAAKLVAGTTMQSLPIMVAAMASGGQTSALVAIGASTASTKNAQLKEENPEMALGTRVLNSANAGIIEAVTGHLFTGASGAVMKKILADKGVDVGSKIIAKSFRSTVEKSIEKNPLISAVGEVIEESAVEFGNQLNDMSSGIRTEFDVHAIKNAGLSATGMGGLQTLGVYGAKGYVKAKTYAKVKSTNKEVFKLRSEIESGNLSDENKAILGLRADRLEAENKKLLGTELEKAKALPQDAKTELNALNAEFEGLKTKFDDIDDADDIPENLKPAMKEEIRIQASKNQKRKTEILSQNDGLEVNDDFSNFNGVEPDFDLENGKISSLPLKEQDRLNDQALQELTGGDMSIEVTKEQVSQKANEIYANEQTPTPEAQPQAEVPQQAEAEKVAEVSPVEDVVATSVEKPISLQEENVSMGDKSVFFHGTNKDADFEEFNLDHSNSGVSNNSFAQGNNGVYLTENETNARYFSRKANNNSHLKKYDKREIETGQKRTKEEIISSMDDAWESLFGKTATEQENIKKVTVNTNARIKDLDFYPTQEQVDEIIKSGDFDGIRFEEKGINEAQDIPSDLRDNMGGKTVFIFNPKVIEKISTNEKPSQGNSTIDASIRPTATNVGESGITKQESPAKEGVSKPVDGGEVKGDAEVGKVKKVKSVKGATYDVTFDNDGNISKITSPKDGREINKFTEREVNDTDAKGRKQYDKEGNVKKKKVLVRNPNYAQIEADALGLPTVNKEKAGKDIDFKVAVDNISETDPYSVALKALVNGAKVSFESIVKETGNKDGKWATNQSDKTLPSIEKLSEQLWGQNPDLDQQEIRNAIIDIISSHSNINSVKESVVEIYNENARKQQEQELHAFLGSLSEKDMAMYQALQAEDSYFEALTDKELDEYHNQKINEYEQGQQEIARGETANEKPEIIVEGNEEKGGIENKPTTKEKIAERIKLSDAKIDNIKDAINGIDSIFGIKIKVDDIDGLNKNGVDIVEVIANIVKQAMAAGIQIDEAISKTIEHLKKTIDFDVNIDDIKERINPKKEADNDFKSKPGKKSVLNRAFEGGNSEVITEAIEKHGLDYRIENQEEAKKLAEDFVNEVGSAVALEAVRNNQIKGAEKAFVYSTIIDNLLGEIEATTDLTERGKLEEEHAKIIADITNELSQEGTDAGRFISALNKVYNSSKLRYNLKTQIDSHKASNNGEISDEVLEKFTQADKRIKELEKLIEEAEAKAKKSEEESSIKNIQEDIERKKQLANKNQSGLTPREQTRKKELSNKFFGRFNDASGVITALADPEFREYLGLTFKQAKGDLDNFTKRVLAELGKGVQKHIPQLFEEGKKSTPVNSKSITIGKSGKLSIPAQLFRDYVEAGETDIDVIAAKIKEDIAEEFPDADVRDIRDALTGYGKQINPTKDEVSIEISRLKRLGKLISAYEDASNGINPLKSGLKQPKPTQEMRDLKKEINRLIKENGLDAVDLEKQWASALDKVKSQLKNQIEDLDKQIANGEKRKIERTTITFDDEATSLKAIRDAKKQILDDMVGKPELTEEQLIARAEKSLQTSIDKLQKEIAEGQIEYKQKPTVKQSQKLDELRKQRKELVDTKNQMREEAGLVEAQRLSNAKKRVKAQIDGLNQRISDKDYSKKEPKPLIEDSELSQLRAEKLMQQEIYDAQKYADELKNRSKFQKWSDAFIELWNVPRILKATGELSTVLIQGGVLTTSRKLTNPKALGKIMKQLLISLGSAKSAANYEALIKASPEYALAIKSKLALTNPDYKSDVREEQYSGDYANLFWDLPFVLAGYNSRLAKVANKERAIFGDVLKKVTGIGTPGTDKLSIRQQWKNVNPFVVLERGGTLYMNTLRMEEFARGTEMLRMEGKNEVDHLQDYKLVANAINSMSGRANLPAAVATSSKFLAAVFFSARNAVSIINQVNPIYYGYLHFGSTDGAQIKKTSVANKLALTNMMRFVTITGLTMLAIKAAAGKDDDDEDVVQIETDPNSSDFMKMKIGDIRFDGFHGMTTMIVLISRLITENVKSTSDGKTTKLGEKRFGPQSRLDLIGSWARNKFAPSMAITANYLATHEEIDPETGDEYRQTPFGKRFADDESLDMTPMYWAAVKEIQAEDPGAMAEFLTVVSVFGWNTSVYEKAQPKKDKFKEKQEKRQEKADLTEEEKAKIKANNSAVKRRSIVNELENELKAAESNTPYYDSKGKLIEFTPVKIKTIKERIIRGKKRLQEKIKKAGDLYKEPEE